MKTLGIVQARLYHYRVPFYEALRERLREENIEFALVHGQPSKHEEGKADSGHLDWAIEIRNQSWFLGGVEILWQPALRYVAGCDLVVVQQENRLLLNYWMFLRRRFVKQKLAFWGHGVNCQSDNPKGVRERWKRMFHTLPDWWFAYTDFTKDVLIGTGYDEGRITVVQNAVDTTRLRALKDDIDDAECECLRRELGIESGRTGIYCGSLYEHKKIHFLIEAAGEIRQQVRDFHLIIIGGGPDSHLVEEASRDNSWVHYVGPKFDRGLALYMKLGDVFLMPGLVGLAILDAFTFGLPIFTTECNLHSPEIAYLRLGWNGFVTAVETVEYAMAVASLLQNPERLHEMQSNCEADSMKYTVQNMTENFVRGVVAAMEE